MSLVSSMNIAQQALSVSQAAITTVSNNIANVDTEGYSKLRVNQSAVVNYTPSAGNAVSVAESASGVTISSVSRYSDFYLQSYYWQENSTNSYLDKYSSMASNVQDLVNELNNNGLSSALENFYDAVNSLSNPDASDITARQNYVDAAQNVCNVFNSTYTKLNDLKESLVGDGTSDGSLDSSEISSEVTQVNSLLDQLAEVNDSIIKTNTGDSSAPSLLDQRDALVSKLSSLIPVKVSEVSNGTVNVSLGDYNLVKGVSVTNYLNVSSPGTAGNPVKISIVDSSDSTRTKDVTDEITGGSIGAILDLCGSNNTKLNINNIISKINTMASGFADVLNEIQIGDPKGDGTVAMAIDKNTKQLINSDNLMFVNSSSPTSTTSTSSHPKGAGDVAGTVTTTTGGVTKIVTTEINGGTTTVTTVTHAAITAGNIQVNSNIVNDPYLVAAARVNSTTGTASDIGNNSNMDLVTDARTNTTYYSNLGGTTIEKYLANMVSSTGTQVSDINTNLKNQNLVLNQVQTNLQSEIGVNLDEELGDLIKYQRAYEAAARIFSTCNSLMEELVNLGK